MAEHTLSPGMSGVLLDIFIKAGSVLYDPSPAPVFEIKDANGFQQGSGFYFGTKIDVGHYDARNFTIPSSTSGTLGDWSIIWTVGNSSKTETFSVANPTLSIIGDDINDIDRIYDHIRIDIGDFQQAIFSDALLERYVIKAVQRLNRELGIAAGKVRPTGITPGGLGTPMRMPAIVLDLNQRTITPDNDEIKDIVVLQAEVLITRAEMSALRRASAATAGQPGSELVTSTSGIVAGGGDGVMIRNADGVVIDTKGRATTWMNNKTKLFIDEAKMREEELAKAIKALKYSFSSNFGKVIY